MRKEWREYHSENGEVWEIFADSNDREKTEDLISKSGNSAVIRKYMKTLDYVQVTIIPCARITDDIKKREGKEKYFRLKINLLNDDDWFGLSRDFFDKEEISKLANMFIGLTQKQAERIWNAKKLGNLNTNRVDL
ncbi:hypothetical protein HYN59_10415 [Flavobacterium album]|uniref:Uncharacterized protein n=1 Tax=Flavobacterium album TaxID=2175091 RepID=A0A2S1QYQ1_9FLAO|nr:hypothetical protein [Flavobacterium album]AWH85504.1 hypothetical protein HYN59_10415 [Flavobacterium album]